MSTNARIGLLTPYLDGDYYGRIFVELLNQANNINSTIFSVQARASVINPVPFNYEVATSVVDGWLLMTNPQSVLPIDLELLKKLESSGKPIVTIGYLENSIKCHSVIIDNHRSTKEAVLHLIKIHGHRRIAFVGNNTEHIDMIERFEGYLEALSEAGIDFDKGLVFSASDTLLQGGYDAADTMLERGINFTAVFASTDLNAIGVIEKLKEVGHQIPEEVAVVGFDDLELSASSNPPLTTVRQSFLDLARVSFDVLYQQISGKIIDHSITRIETQFMTRSSCGCSYLPAVEPSVDVQKQLKESNKNLDNIVKRYDKFVERWASATREKKFNFANMFSGKSHWGCLGLWDNDENGHKDLIITQAFSKNGDSTTPIGLRVPIDQFPPSDWIPKISKNDFVRVQSVRNERGDWGFIAIVGPVDELILISAADITQVSFTISASAMERDELFQQIRLIAEQLEIVSRTTNDGIWDWDIINNNINWNVRSQDIFHLIGENLPNNSLTFLKLVHPDDYTRLVEISMVHLEKGIPIRIEFRLQGKNGEIIWVYVTGDSLHNQNEKTVRIIGSITNISEKKKVEEQIKYLAFHDGLTGLPNRELVRERLNQYMEEADNERSKLGILMIDLDRFKIINDTLGHQAGDQLIQKVANFFENAIHSTDSIFQGSDDKSIVGRLGGDEFIMIISHIQDVSELRYGADQMIQRFKEPFDIQNHDVFTSASIGISLYPDHGRDFDELTRCADMAMYRAKENGKNQMEVYSAELHSLATERFTMENRLRKALERNEFLLYYQPQITLKNKNNRIVGIEALIRWDSPEQGIVSPLDFIPIAEETGLIISIGYWVLKEACQQNKRWMDQGLPPMTVSVNISARQLQQKDFVEMVKFVLEETQLPPTYLCLEITESTAIKNVEISMDMLKELGELGINISIDDFGTGYSSLAMLKQLPITNIKIDKSFIRDMDTDKDNAAIVKAIIAMATTLELSVTAEGVETEEQKAILLDESCNYMQGYYFSKPLTANDLESLVLKRMDDSSTSLLKF